MIRPLNLYDLPRQALLGKKRVSNHAYTLDSLGGEARRYVSLLDVARLEFWLKRRSVCSLIETRNNHVAGIASAKPRRSIRTWEISHLLLGTDSASSCVDLVKMVSQDVAHRGGERVFLRMLADDPLVEGFQLCGFTKCNSEILYRGHSKPNTDGASVPLRRRRATDNYDLFRLYCASTPAKTRSILGVTYGQWVSSRESCQWRDQEYVYELKGAVKGWLRVVQRPGSSQLTLMVHPDHEANLAAMLRFGITRRHWSKTTYCLVQEHQQTLRCLLDGIEFEPIAEFITLSRSMVAPVGKEQARRAVRLAGIGPAFDLSEGVHPPQEVLGAMSQPVGTGGRFLE